MNVTSWRIWRFSQFCSDHCHRLEFYFLWTFASVPPTQNLSHSFGTGNFVFSASWCLSPSLVLQIRWVSRPIPKHFSILAGPHDVSEPQISSSCAPKHDVMVDLTGCIFDSGGGGGEWVSGRLRRGLLQTKGADGGRRFSIRQSGADAMFRVRLSTSLLLHPPLLLMLLCCYGNRLDHDARFGAVRCFVNAQRFLLTISNCETRGFRERWNA